MLKEPLLDAKKKTIMIVEEVHKNSASTIYTPLIIIGLSILIFILSAAIWMLA